MYIGARGTWSVKRIAALFGESEATIRRKIAVIEMMAENSDPDREHFSYYDVLYGIQQNAKRERDRSLLWATVLGQIRGMKSDESADRYTAMELRRRLPDVMKKPKIEKRFAAGKISLEDAFQSARISRVEERLRKALTIAPRHHEDGHEGPRSAAAQRVQAGRSKGQT